MRETKRLEGLRRTIDLFLKEALSLKGVPYNANIDSTFVNNKRTRIEGWISKVHTFLISNNLENSDNPFDFETLDTFMFGRKLIGDNDDERFLYKLNRKVDTEKKVLLDISREIQKELEEVKGPFLSYNKETFELKFDNIKFKITGSRQRSLFETIFKDKESMERKFAIDELQYEYNQDKKAPKKVYYNFFKNLTDKTLSKQGVTDLFIITDYEISINTKYLT